MIDFKFTSKFIINDNEMQNDFRKENESGGA